MVGFVGNVCVNKPCNSCIHVFTASNQTDEEDIDIVGDDKDRQKDGNTSLSSTDSGRSRGTTTDSGVTAALVYGPPQFTEADVLAAVAKCAEEKKAKNDGELENDDGEEGKENKVKKEILEGDGEDVDEGEQGRDGDDQEEDLEALKAKVKKLETNNNKCSKCMVRVPLSPY